jgi:hypothetical protein
MGGNLICHSAGEESKVKLARIFEAAFCLYEIVPKIHTVILSEAKNLLFHHFLKRRDPSYSLRMTKKGKLTGILEHSFAFICFHLIQNDIIFF